MWSPRSTIKHAATPAPPSPILAARLATELCVRAVFHANYTTAMAARRSLHWKDTTDHVVQTLEPLIAARVAYTLYPRKKVSHGGKACSSSTKDRMRARYCAL
jgi:hypothetical protein